MNNTTGQTTGLRWCVLRDLPELVEIERASFASPWGEEDFRARLRHRNSIVLVAERGVRVVGHVVYELHEHGLHVVRLTVVPDCRRQGVARLILGKLYAKLYPGGRTCLTAEVHEGALEAHLMLRVCGWQAVEVLRGRGEDGGDSYLFHRVL
jgi:[ribosomal protein S18]-alanine N-acetyltransferase